MCHRPGDPINGHASDDLQVRIDAHPIRKQDQVVAGAGHDQAVAAQKLDGRTDLLGARHVDAGIGAFRHAERRQVGPDQLQRSRRHHAQRVQHDGLRRARVVNAGLEPRLFAGEVAVLVLG